ncbi:MAG: hypothetical protein CMB80_12470 [Flammeovirgaceae bacterium]|nr:hypothetical protein [Flammeovirgaceae bacterium]|tara:strand:- start:883 stop:1155 length:273 start_codon:yes stop_codon:yes gene_type:complete
MKIKVNKPIAMRDQETGMKKILSKGLHDVADKLGKWLCQVYPLNCSYLGESDSPKAEVAKPKPKPKPKAKPKAKAGRPKAKKKAKAKGKK